MKTSTSSRYPKEDVCRHCGTHIGWIMSPDGDAMALGVCDRCAAMTRSPRGRRRQCPSMTVDLSAAPLRLPTSLARIALDALKPMDALYPWIPIWARRALADIARGDRALIAALDPQGLAGLGILKPGRHAKLCTLLVTPRARRKGIGAELLRRAIALATSAGAATLRVAYSEAAADACGPLFSRAGFAPVAAARNRHARGADEHVADIALCPLLRSPCPRRALAMPGTAWVEIFPAIPSHSPLATRRFPSGRCLAPSTLPRGGGQE